MIIRNLKKLLFLFILMPGLSFANPPGTSLPMVFNPSSGYLDWLGPGQGLTPGQNYYLYKSGSQNAYLTFDGNQLCLFVNSVSQQCWPSVVVTPFLLIEDGTFLLLEDGTKLIIQP